MKKPFHKHIAHHTKRYTKHLTKYLYERDTIFATIGVFVFLIILGMIPLNFGAMNPMKMALQDFDFNDITYSNLEKGKGKDDKFDRRIAIVNIGHLDREGIAYLIEKVNTMNPKVIGLDALFEGAREPEKDSILRSVLEKTNNLVGVSRILPKEDSFVVDANYFDESLKKRGSAILLGEGIGTIRLYNPFETILGQKYPHITTAIVKEFDSIKYEIIIKRNKETETINYTNRKDKYQIIEAEDLMNENVETKLITDKIVLIGYIATDVNDIEDKKFTPMNDKVVGKSLPDMDGIVVQANIISMVLDGNYIKKTPKWVAWLIAILIGWLHMSLFIRYYLEDHIWFHLVAKIAQVFSAIFFAYLGIEIFARFGIKLDMKYTLYVIALAVDVIYFYEAFATWLHKKYHYATIFGHHHPVEEPKHEPDQTSIQEHH